MDIIVLFFLCKYIYKKAVKKGLPPTHWIFYFLSLWFFGFFIGINIASLFYVIDKNNILSKFKKDFFKKFEKHFTVNLPNLRRTDSNRIEPNVTKIAERNKSNSLFLSSLELIERLM